MVTIYESGIHPHQNNKFDDYEEAASCSQVKVRMYGHKEDSIPSNPDKYTGMLDIQVGTKQNVARPVMII